MATGFYGTNEVVFGDIEDLVLRSETAASNAETSETNAAASAASASTDATTASNAATSASASADSATTSATAAEAAAQAAQAGGSRVLDLNQTGQLVVGTIWGIDASTSQTRALPLAPDDNSEVGFYVRGDTGDVRNNPVTIQVTAPDSIAGDTPGASYVIDNDLLLSLKYNANDQNWELINDSLATRAGNIKSMPFAVVPIGDASNTINAVDGSWQKVTLTANRDFTFDLKAGEFVFLTVAPGAFTLSYTNVTEWVGGSSPTSIGAETLFMFWSDDGVAVTGQHIGDVS